MCNDIFFVLIFIVFDHRISSSDNMCFGTVISLELKHLNIRSILLHIEKIFHQSTSPSINTLKIISNQRNICSFLVRIASISTHHSHQFKLNPVGILRLIYENKIKGILPLLERFFTLEKKLIRQEQ